MKNTNPMLLTDFYKTIHHKCYADGMTKLVSYWTPRMTRTKENEVVMFGLQGFIKKYLIDYFNDNFFNLPKAQVIADYKRVISYSMGAEHADTLHIERLHDLGYLPIEINAVEEGTLVPIKVPMFSITNTHDDFAWLVNYLETIISCHVWLPITSATTGHAFRKIMNKYYEKTVVDGNVEMSCGDFSMRGMSCLESAESSSSGHLLSFKGSATIPAILYLEKYYNCELGKDIIGLGTPSTEHSVMCSYGRWAEIDGYKRLINEVYPNGILSIVSDTYDYWSLIEHTLPILKDDILKRDGKIVIRGDSGDPVKIICGSCEITDLENDKYCKTLEECKRYMKDCLVEEISNDTPHGECGSDENTGIFKFQGKYYEMIIDLEWNRYDKQYYYIDRSSIKSCKEVELTLEQKGTVEALWDLFGGTINAKGYKVLDSHIGCVYGDSITLDRAEDICGQLTRKGFATNNVVLGIGSFTYNMVSRDTYGFCLKGTHAVINGKEVQIFKDPKSDSGNFKKSQKGMCVVFKDENNIISCKDELTINQAKNYEGNLLKVIFENGEMKSECSLEEIRNKLNGGNN
ncbi:nicotinate phosphoribosyltransferase [Clostridium tagluense]|uniref:Nicotinamide phosphoribosyltransferase n=1 Tax=Clostridium tagluense TaxID=360422 RepID=A0A401UQ99_9CLOT|nr:nicotinate phosphoribosyltransferase [Clostridium tagluense]GCD11696.1 hypothetical protein Ctaglu_33190 [Clostridium tagluense]